MVFDKDDLTDDDFSLICTKISEVLKIKAYGMPVYTQEAVLLTDFEKLSKILVKYLSGSKQNPEINHEELRLKLIEEYNTLETVLKIRYSGENVDQEIHKRYKGAYSDKTSGMFDLKKSLIENDPVKLCVNLSKYYNKVIEEGLYYKLSNKSDIEKVINSGLSDYHYSIDIESDFYEMIRLIDKSTWYKEWDYLKEI